MTPRSHWPSRLFILLAVALIFPAAALADIDLSGPASIVTAVITMGIAAFGILALYVFYLTGRFLWTAFQEAVKLRKEVATHAAPYEGKKGKGVLSAAFALNAFFAIFAVGFLFAAFLILTSGLDPANMKSMSSLVIHFCLGSFALLFLYIVYLTICALWEKFKPTKTAPAEGLEGMPVTRRSFLSLLGWAWVVFTAATMGALSTVLRFFFPNVTFEPPLKFMAGFPDTYAYSQTGVVDERYKQSNRCWIVRNNQGFYALSTICTHLGCTPNWMQADQKFKCPCHGSGYYVTGVNFEGPAPRPLPRFNIILTDDGQIQVDQSIEYQQELGQWGLPGSFLDYKA